MSATHVDIYDKTRKAAFTLAEVLITLGIIGVVAALTITPLVHKYKMKQYETAFKKVNANIQNAINLALVDSGYQKITDIAKLCAEQGARPSASCASSSKAELQRVWDNVLLNLNVVKMQYGGFATPYGLGGLVKTVSGVNSNLYYMLLYGVNGCVAILNDGSAIGCKPDLHYHTNGDMYYTFDTNGPYKKPNRVGYDIFIVNNRNSQSCDINSTSTDMVWGGGSSSGCYNRALKNKSLDNKSKNYWESLK